MWTMAGVLVGMLGAGTWSTTTFKEANDHGAVHALEIKLLEKQKQEDIEEMGAKEVSELAVHVYVRARARDGGAVLVVRRLNAPRCTCSSW